MREVTNRYIGHTRSAQKRKKSPVYKNKPESSKLEVVEYYKTHSFMDTITYFFISSNTVLRILQEYSIPKQSYEDNLRYARINHYGPLLKDYHKLKSDIAHNANYRCIHVWDWDNVDKVVNSLHSKDSLYARKLTVEELSIKECNEFLNQYHFQNTCKGQIVRLGLYYNDELIQLMTFGTPRYNKKYQWELLRLCTKSNYKVVGRAEKLFKHFVHQYSPESIISYCDNLKFTGEVYIRLGFILKDKGQPSKHWYNERTGQHFTDNLVRQRGVDQLLGTSYGKGTDNNELLKTLKFVEVYDSGQSTYIFS